MSTEFNKGELLVFANELQVVCGLESIDKNAGVLAAKGFIARGSHGEHNYLTAEVIPPQDVPEWYFGVRKKVGKKQGIYLKHAAEVVVASIYKTPDIGRVSKPVSRREFKRFSKVSGALVDDYFLSRDPTNANKHQATDRIADWLPQDTLESFRALPALQLDVEQ